MPHALMLSNSPSLLAVLPETSGYIDPLKIGFFVVCVIAWAYSAGWVPADMRKTRMPPGMWIPLVFGTGAAGLLIWLLLPFFWLGLLLFAASFGTGIILYVLARNKRVPPTESVLTIHHLKRLGKRKGEDEEATAGLERVRIKGADGKSPPWPTDPEQSAGYQALQDLLFDAIWRRASDVKVDFAPPEAIKIIYRIDGVDRVREPMDANVGGWVFTHTKRIAGLNMEEKRRPQSGKFKASIGAGGKADKSVEVMVRTSGSTTGEGMRFRFISDESKFRVADLGFTPKQLEAIQKLIAADKGVFIVSGPKGSGVTSTIYALLRAHDAFIKNIHTLEVSKSMDLENITQHTFDSQDGTVTFGKRFRSLLRTEPDVAMAGEVPDAETASLAAAAGRQGKRVYLGLPAKDVFHALHHYLQGVGDPALAASSLLAITNQRLTRILCTSCRKAYRPDPAILKKGNLPTGEDRPFYRPPNPNEVEVDKKGNPLVCAICQGSGYSGRTGVFELLIVDENIRDQVAKSMPIPAIRSECRKRGMLLLQEVALHKVYEGVTSINEVLRVTKDDSPKPVKAS